MSSKEETKILQPRSYQLELLEYVVKRNAIIFLPTGSGKTFVALLALKRFSHEMERPVSQGGKRGFFICNTVELARQQALGLKKSLNLTIGLYVGERGVDDWCRQTWEKEIEKNQIMVGTVQIFVDIINQNYIKVTDLSIVVIDECHHATGGHPMHQFLANFQKIDPSQQPRVIGLTGVLLKGNKLNNVEKDLKALEATFRGNIITVSSMEQYHNVMVYSTKPKEVMISYDDLSTKFDIEDKIIGIMKEALRIVDAWNLGNIPVKLSKNFGRVVEPNKKNFINNMLNDFHYQMSHFGLYGASIAIMSVIIELEIKKRQSETIALRNLYRTVITHCDHIRHLLVTKLMDMVDESDGKMDTEDVILNFSSPKMRSLLTYLKKEFENMDPKDICSLVFVERRYTAKCVYYVIQKYVESVPTLANVLRPQFMVGRNSISPGIQNILERKWTKEVIDRFRDQECNLIVCSSVLEEGIDVQACNYVFVLDPLKTFSAYIQTKGRARKTGSTYAVFASKQEINSVVSRIRKYQEIHEIIKKFLIGRTVDEDDPKEEEVAEQFVEYIKPFVTENGARLNAESALNVLSRYCQQLPSDVFGACTPWWTKQKCADKVVVTLKLPLQSTVKDTIFSDPMETTKLAKISAAFKACVKLYENGELNDHILPITKRQCVEKVSDIFFKHWMKHPKDDKKAGSKQNRRSYERFCPEELYQALPIVGNACFAYEIKLTAEFEADEYDRHIVEMLKSQSNYAILLSKRLPSLAEMPLFMTQGKVGVKIANEPHQLVIENEEQLEYLCMFHTMIFRDLLECWKEKKFFVVDRRNKQNSFLLTPLKNGSIDWNVVKKFQRLSPIRKYSLAERKKKKYKAEDFLGSIVNTWYALNESERYVVTKVLSEDNPGSPFPSGTFDSYADFVNQKYGEQVANMQQFLIEVKSLTSRRNFFVNAKNKMTKKLASRKRARIILIPEMCHNFMYPGDLWLKALFLPSILHRLNTMLHAENLRKRINKFLGLNKTLGIYEPKPLIIDSSLKRVVDADGNVIEAVEEPQKLLPSLPTVQKQQDYFQVHTLTHDAAWKDYMEPSKNVQVDVNSLFPVEIDYYYKFISGLATDLEALVLEDVEEYTNTQLSIPKTKSVKKPSAEKSCLPIYGIADVPLAERRRIKILERSEGTIATITASAEQSEFVAALTTAGANDVFDMERFEVLGDSFLKLSMSLYLMHKFPKWHEGFLTEVKSKLVSNRNLLYCMLETDIPQRICATMFKPNSEWLPPLVSVPSNILELVDKKPPTIRHISPADLYSIELSDDEVLTGRCSQEQVTGFINSCSQHQTVADLLTFESDVLTFIYKQSISDKVVADTLEAILGVCVQNYGIQQSFRMLKFFNLCEDINGKSLTHLFDLDLGSPLLRTNITSREIDGFLINYKQLEANLGYNFKDRAYLLQALTHPSYPTNRLTGCYQELEFIGDAILDFLISCYIFERCETKNPGELTDLRSALVNNITLGCVCVRHRFHLYLLAENAVLAEAIKNFDEYQKTQNYCVTDQVRILMEENDCEAGSLNLAANIDVPKTLGDIVEALIAAVYLDSRNLTITWNVIYHLLQQEINQFMCKVPVDPVRLLYECKGADPKFYDPVVDNEVIMVKCSFSCLNKRREVNGFGTNKTNAKKSAAKHALQILCKN